MAMTGSVQVVAIRMDGEPVPGAIAGSGWTPTPDPAVQSSITDFREVDGRLELDVDTGTRSAWPGSLRRPDPATSRTDRAPGACRRGGPARRRLWTDPGGPRSHSATGRRTDGSTMSPAGRWPDHRSDRGGGLRRGCPRLGRHVANQRRGYRLPGRDDLVLTVDAGRDRRPDPTYRPGRAVGDGRGVGARTPVRASRSWTVAVSPEVAQAIRPGGEVPRLEGRRISVTVDSQVTADRPLAVEVRFGSRSGRPMKAYLGPFRQGRSTRGRWRPGRRPRTAC